MAAGEYNSMRVQAELLERELDVERRQLAADPEVETLELTQIYEARGVDRGTAAEASQPADGRPGPRPRGARPGGARHRPRRRSARRSGPPVSSFVVFAVGAVVPLLPWFFASGH